MNFFSTILIILWLVVSTFAANLALHKQSDSVTFASQTTTGSTQTVTLLAEIRYGGGADGYLIGSNDDFDLRINGGRIELSAFSGTESRTLTSPAQYDDSQWHVVIIVQNGTSLSMYVDGSLVNSTNFTTSNNRARKILALGQRGNSTNFAKAAFRRVGLWNKSFTAGEVTAINPYAALSAQTNLVAGYNCNEGSGTTITDVSGNTKNGVINNPNSVYTNWIDADRTTPTTFYASPTGSMANNGTASGSAWSLDFALSHPPVMIAGDTLKLVSGTYNPTAKLNSYLTGTSTNRITIETDSTRGLFPNVVKINGSNITVGGTILSIYGKYANYWDLEVFNANPARVSAQSGSQPTDIVKLAGVDVLGQYLKIYNLHTHDNNGNGLTCFDPSATVEFLGILLTYNNGWTGSDRDHGHGIYTHNGNTGANILYENVVTFNNYEYLIQHYSSQYQNDSYNIEFDGLHGSGGSGIQIVGAGPKHNFVFRDVNSYNNLVMGYADEDNYDFLLERAIVQAFGSPITTRSWRTPVIKDSTIISNTTNLNSALGRVAQVSGALGAGASFTNNAYYAKTGANTSQLMRYESQLGVLVNYWTFAQWQSNLGLDLNSSVTISATGKPTSNQLKYYADAHTPGRGLLVVWNWLGSANVTVDLSNYGLVNNQNYKIYDAYNPSAGIISQGNFNSASPTISLSTASNGVTPKTNDVANTEGTTAPEFGIFLVIPGTVAAGAPAAPSLPTLPTRPAVSTSSTAVQLNWVDNASDETSILVRYRIGNGDWTQNTLGTNLTTTTITGLTPATTYDFQVAFANASGQSVWLDLGLATTTVIRHFGATEPR